MQVVKSFQYEGVKAFKFGYGLFGKPQMYVHCFFIDGLLIDTAQRNTRKTVLKHLSKLPVQQIFITHHHEDHTGNLKPLQKHFQWPAYAHPLCVEMMKNPPSISFGQWLTWGSRSANFNLIPIENQINTPNHSFEIISIPGHAVDHTCLYERDKGWLFSADLFINDFIRYFMRAESMKAQIQSIRKILRLEFEVLFCSHNPKMTNGKKHLAAKLQFLESFYGEVMDLYHRGYDDALAILRQLALKGKVDLKKDRASRLLSGGNISTLNMVKSVLRDEGKI